MADYKTRQKKFACQLCKKEGVVRVFKLAQALGGHMSKKHPNQSLEFTGKQLRREERTCDRQVLAQAKDIYYMVYGEKAILFR